MPNQLEQLLQYTTQDPNQTANLLAIMKNAGSQAMGNAGLGNLQFMGSPSQPAPPDLGSLLASSMRATGNVPTTTIPSQPAPQAAPQVAPQAVPQAVPQAAPPSSPIEALLAQLQGDVKNTDVSLVDGKLTAKGKKTAPKKKSMTELYSEMAALDAKVNASGLHPIRKQANRAELASSLITDGMDPYLANMWADKGSAAFEIMRQLQASETPDASRSRLAIAGINNKADFVKAAMADPAKYGVESGMLWWKGLSPTKLKLATELYAEAIGLTDGGLAGGGGVDTANSLVDAQIADLKGKM